MKTSVRKSEIDDFLSQKTLALVGASRSGRKFGNAILKELGERGYRVHPIHPEAGTVESVRAWPDYKSLPEPVGGVVISVSPKKALSAVEQAAAAGVRRVWIQQGSVSEDAVRFCRDRGVALIAGECILMHVEPVRSIHRFHRGIRRICGRMPR